MKKIEEAAKKELFIITPSYLYEGDGLNAEIYPYYDNGDMVEMFKQGAQWQQANQWQVGELPNQSFVFILHKIGDDEYYDTAYKNGDVFMSHMGVKEKDVIAWMPIPELP